MQDSLAKLRQVVIGMKVAQAHPLYLRHSVKVEMRRPLKVSSYGLGCGKAINQDF